MELFLIPVLFIWGTIFGSFLNVLIDRFSTDRPVIKGRSYCENCHKTLSWKELIPLFSFILQKGKCAHCKARIPARLFMVELLIGLVVLVTYFYGISHSIPLFPSIMLGIIIYCFIGIFFSDLEYGLIPDKFLYIMILPIVFYLTATNLSFTNHFLSAVGVFVFFFFLFALTRGRGMGFGDVKLAPLIGLFLGFPLVVLMLYIAFLTGAFISIILVLCRQKKLSGGTVPFGPFLVVSTVICIFYGKDFLLPLVLRFI